MEGKWAPQIGKENKYGYNGKELDDDFGLNWHHYGFRMYDAAIGRFPSADPIAENFVFVSPYNYAENSPIANIDLWGLQKVFFGSDVVNNKTFQDSYDLNRKTSGGKKFQKALDNQNQIDVFYTSTDRVDGLTKGPFDSMSSLQKASKESYFLATAINGKTDELAKAFEEGNDIMVIAVDCSDTCEDSDIRETTINMNHEEVAHGLNRLLGIEKSTFEEHKDFQNQASQTSPSNDEIKTDSKYQNTEAKKQLNEIDKLMGNEK